MKLISDSLGLKHTLSSCFDITREAKVPYGFIDLLIVTSDNKAIIIENKIDAGDQKKQIMVSDLTKRFIILLSCLGKSHDI